MKEEIGQMTQGKGKITKEKEMRRKGRRGDRRKVQYDT